MLYCISSLITCFSRECHFLWYSFISMHLAVIQLFSLLLSIPVCVPDNISIHFPLKKTLILSRFAITYNAAMNNLYATHLEHLQKFSRISLQDKNFWVIDELIFSFTRGMPNCFPKGCSKFYKQHIIRNLAVPHPC